MKLRIQNDSLRLRLTRSEVEQLNVKGEVDGSIRFDGRASLVYSVVASDNANSIGVSYEDNRILVTVPREAVTPWAESAQVSLGSADSVPSILIEKDFQCLHGLGQTDPEAFPNPRAS